MGSIELEPTFADKLRRVCRAEVGDKVRSVTHFTENDVEQIYLRSDLDRTADLMGFAELERTGFRASEMYRNSELGAYEATVRMFEHGYLTRVISGRHGVWVTTDSLSLNQFEDLVSALKSALATDPSEIEAK
ncbi:DUF7522 family protein [Natronococcus wangiae]|uniref:DUF7522 family protein n=1 Tax=Natronococcus wangiae TaxID=3068275 RepID=UPI00273FF96D|nr:hypothetical protein [Natronococcus sp. AD5]